MLAIPVKKTPRLIFLVLVAIFAVYIGYVYSLVRSAPEEILIPVSLGAEPIQRSIARHELFRRIYGSESDGVDALYVTISLVGEDDFDMALATKLAEDLLEAGVDINGTTAMGFPLLHQAINMINPRAVTFLLENCADPGALLSMGPDEDATQMSALELAYLMEREFPHLEYSSVVEVLERADLGSDCDLRN